MMIDAKADSKLVRKINWKLDLGANWDVEGVSFRVWAPKCKQIDAVLQNETHQIIPLERKDNGYFTIKVPHLVPSTLYHYRINGDKQYPDPCSRFQPEGPHGPSMIIDPHRFEWHDQD